MFKALKILCEVLERCQTAHATKELFLCQNPVLLCCNQEIGISPIFWWPQWGSSGELEV